MFCPRPPVGGPSAAPRRHAGGPPGRPSRLWSGEGDAADPGWRTEPKEPRAGAAEVTATKEPYSGGLPSISAGSALKFYRSSLSEFERSEVLDYPHVYFLGAGTGKVQASLSDTKQNYGYDDERGDYRVVLHDHIAYRYEVLTVLGQGSFGQVLKALDCRTGRAVALKVIRNRKRFHLQALVEVKVLETLRQHDPLDCFGVVRMVDYFYFRNHLCITFELLSLNLYELTQRTHFAGFSLPLVRRFAVQLLTALKFFHRQGVIHCDMKPENILLKTAWKTAVKVIDFGSSCFENEQVYSYIQSRFYRAPEILLGIPYGPGIDMWSFGCIVAELFTGAPLFPGETEEEQMDLIMEVLGVPPDELLLKASRQKHFFDNKLQPRHSTRAPQSLDLAEALQCPDSAFVSFVKGFLHWDPALRFSADDGLRH
eukprot:RCo042009